MEEIQNSHGQLASGLRVSPSLVVGTSITQYVVMEGKGEWSLTKKKSWSVDMILRQEPSINSTDASGMDVLASQGPMTSTVRL